MTGLITDHTGVLALPVDSPLPGITWRRAGTVHDEEHGVQCQVVLGFDARGTLAAIGLATTATSLVHVLSIRERRQLRPTAQLPLSLELVLNMASVSYAETLTDDQGEAAEIRAPWFDMLRGDLGMGLIEGDPIHDLFVGCSMATYAVVRAFYHAQLFSQQNARANMDLWCARALRLIEDRIPALSTVGVYIAAELATWTSVPIDAEPTPVRLEDQRVLMAMALAVEMMWRLRKR